MVRTTKERTKGGWRVGELGRGGGGEYCKMKRVHKHKQWRVSKGEQQNEKNRGGNNTEMTL